jgi:hypothetical protein
MANDPSRKKPTLADLTFPNGAESPIRGLHEAATAMYSHAAAQNELTEAVTETGKTLEAEQYAARDAAWQAHYTEHHMENRYHNSMVIAATHDGFNAGWAARKKIDHEMAWGLDKFKAE